MSNEIVSRGNGNEEEVYFDQIATLFEQIAEITTDMKDDIRVLKERGTDYRKGIIMTSTVFETDCSLTDYRHQLQSAVAAQGLVNSVPNVSALQAELNDPTDIEQDIIDWANGTYTGD